MGKSHIISFVIIIMIFVSSCSSQDNGGNTQLTDGADKVPFSQAWDGYKDLQGQSYGDILSLPDKIEPMEIDRLYSFVPVDGPDLETVTLGTVPFLKEFFGDSFNEAYVSENADSLTKSLASYNSPEGDYGKVMFSGPQSASKGGTGTDIIETMGIYEPGESDVRLELDGGSCTVGQVCETVKSFCNKTLFPLYEGYEFEPVRVTYYVGTDMKQKVRVTCGLKYKGLLMEPFFSRFNQIDDRGFYQVMTYYSPNFILFDLDRADSIFYFSNISIPSKKNEEELTEIISLKKAVELLKENLAPNSQYRVEKISLMYCQKFTYPALWGDEKLDSDIMADFGDPQAQPYVPTWCFTWEKEIDGFREIFHLKVNAVTGEITVDV